MKVKHLLLLLGLIVTIPRCFSQSCADSSIHLQYIFPDSLDNLQQVQLRDGGRFQLTIKHRLSGIVSNVFTRFSSQQRIAWSQQVLVPVGFSNVHFSRVLELANGNILVSGFGTLVGTGKFFQLMLLSSQGVIQWQKRFDFQDIVSPTGNFAASNKFNYSLCEDNSGNIIASFYVEPESIAGEKIALLCVDEAGTVQWAKTVVMPTVLETATSIWKSRVVDQTLWLYGATLSSLTNCLPAILPGYINRGKLFALAIDLNTFSIIMQKVYCPPITVMTGNTGSISGYQHYYYSFGTGHFNDEDVFFLSRGRVALTRAFLRATNNPTEVNWLFSISYFDEAFQHIKSEVVSTGPIFLSKTAMRIEMDSTGTKHFQFIDYNQGKLYYAVADSNNNFITQKKLNLNLSFSNYGQSHFEELRHGLFTSFEAFNISNNQTSIDYFEIQKKDLDKPCFGEDTAFLTISAGTVGPSSLSGAVTIRNSNLVETPTYFSFTLLNPLTTAICIEKRICDTLKLHGPPLNCTTPGPLILTAHKNPLCEGAINFQFDTLAVSAWYQPNDTTLVLTTLQYSGKIFASAASCPSLKDSLVVNYSSGFIPLNIGADQVFCPGQSYLLNASSRYSEYQWQDGSHDSTLRVNEPGSYSVIVRDECNNFFYDTVVLKVPPLPLYAGADTSICKFATLPLIASAGYENYRWMDLTTAGPAKEGRQVVVNPQISSLYQLTAILYEGCVQSDSIAVVINDCALQFFIPSAFTPNGDGRNDLFKPLISGELSSYEFVVYNRWGSIVFQAKSPNQGWNGRLHGTQQATATFVWKCNYQFYDQPPRTATGVVTLIR